MMEDEILDSTNNLIPAKRTDAMSALGILGFINTGVFLLIYLLGVFGTMGLSDMPDEEWNQRISEAFEQYESMMSPEDMENALTIMPIIKEKLWVLLLLLFVLTAVRLLAIIQMWKLKAHGWVIYATSQGLRVFAPIMVIGMAGLSIFGAILAAGMTLGWYSQRKHMA